MTFEVELFSWEKDPETVDERREAAEKARSKGNDYFKQEQYEEAITKYEAALDYWKNQFGLQDTEKIIADASKLPCQVHLATSCLLVIGVVVVGVVVVTAHSPCLDLTLP